MNSFCHLTRCAKQSTQRVFRSSNMPLRVLGNGKWDMKRDFHIQWNFNFKDYKKEEQLRKEADANPLDPILQATLLKQINKHNPAKVVERVESGRFANNEQTLREYVRALYKENKLENLQLANVLRVPTLAAAGGAGMVGTVEGPGQSHGNGSGHGNGNGYGGYGMGFNGPLRVQQVRGKWESMVMIGTVLGVLGVVWYMEHTAAAGSGGVPMFNVPGAHSSVTDVNTCFDDVKGADEAKAELQEVVEYLRNPTKFTQVGAKLPKGVLMCGPPGTGKTLLAKAMAGEAGVPFLYCAGSAFDEVYVGVGSKRVRQLFKEASEKAPCIVFIDEIDAVGSSRDSTGKGGNKDNTLQQLLTELDGFNTQQGVIVIAATNTPESLDPALVRPGRFDRQVVVNLPDVAGRKQIFDLYLKKVAVADDVDSEVLARSTPGFSGADISQLINASAIKAVLGGQDRVTMQAIDSARDDIIMGRARGNAPDGSRKHTVDRKTLEMTAYHEGGHALLAYHTRGPSGSDPIHKATIIQRGQSLGMVTQLPEGDQLSYSREQMEARLAVLMAGRAAEEMIYGRNGTTSGASSDLKMATRLASMMVREWGFSDRVGLVHIGASDRASPSTSQAVDDEIRDMLQARYQFAMKVLAERREELDLIAKTLLDKETLSGDEIQSLLENHRKLKETTKGSVQSQ